MAEDGLDIVDLETAILNGRITMTERDDVRGVRHTVHGVAADGVTPVGLAGRFTETGRYLINHRVRGHRRMSEFGYRCEHCDGTVRPKRVKREAFRHKARFVILEDVTIGVCDECGSRFYPAETLKRVREVATGAISPERFDEVPVASAR